MALYRCAACGSPNVVTDTQNEGYNYVKGAIGTVVLGVGGAVAGINGKTKRVYKCPDCGLTLNDPMPFEMKTLIDMGTMSLSARENLKLNGIKIDWDHLKSKYKNIEDCNIDRIAAEEQAYTLNAVSKMATATQEEFDWAIDTIQTLKNKDGYYAHEERVFSVDSPIEKQEYEDGLVALKIIIENVFAFFPPSCFQKYTEKEYRGLKLNLSNFLYDYVVMLHIQDTGEFFVKTRGDGQAVIAAHPFIKGFVKAYQDVIDWSYNTKTGEVSFPLSSPLFSFFYEEIFLYIRENHPIPSQILIPRWRINDGNLGDWDYSYYDSPLREIGATYPEFTETLKESYFKAYPEKKTVYEKLMKEWAELEASKKWAETESKKKKEYEELLIAKKRIPQQKRQKIAELRAEIMSLEKKIFFKGKAQKQIEEINAFIVRIENEIKDAELATVTLQEQIKEAEAASLMVKAYSKQSKDFIYRILHEMDYFIVWHWTDNAI